MFKNIGFFISLFLFTAYAYSWYPTKDTQEFRLMMKSDLSIEGQMIDKKILNDNLLMRGIFSLGEIESSLGASFTYEINKMVHLTYAGSLTNDKHIHNRFLVNAAFELGNEYLVFYPFVSFSDHIIGEGGIIIYFHLGKVPFHIGAAMGLNEFDYLHPYKHSLFFLGTSFNKFSSKKELEHLLTNPKSAK